MRFDLLWLLRQVSEDGCSTFETCTVTNNDTRHELLGVPNRCDQQLWVFPDEVADGFKRLLEHLWACGGFLSEYRRLCLLTLSDSDKVRAFAFAFGGPGFLLFQRCSRSDFRHYECSLLLGQRTRVFDALALRLRDFFLLPSNCCKLCGKLFALTRDEQFRRNGTFRKANLVNGYALLECFRLCTSFDCLLNRGPIFEQIEHANRSKFL